MLAISLRSGITRNPKHLLAGTSLGFDYMKKSKYISEDKRGGFKVAKVNLPLSDGKLRIFLEGKEDWLEEGLLVPAKKKNKRGRIIGEGSSRVQGGGAQQNYVSPFVRIPAPLSCYGCVPMQAWGSGAAMPPPNFVVPNVTFAEPYAHLPQPQQSVHHWRIRCKKTCKLLQPSKPMQTKWVKKMQTSLKSFDTFT
jgi:hypothetical protein